jgi:hypothetical protein
LVLLAGEVVDAVDDLLVVHAGLPSYEDRS